jgi:hypothetical protein
MRTLLLLEEQRKNDAFGLDMTYSLKVKQGSAVHELNEVHLIQEASASLLPSLSAQKLKAARILSSSSNMGGQ